VQKAFGRIGADISNRIGWNTNAATRPHMLSDLKNALDTKTLGVYDREIIEELYSFIINKQGKPVAENNANDDLVIALAGAFQMYQTEEKRLSLDIGGGVPYDKAHRTGKWGYYGFDKYK